MAFCQNFIHYLFLLMYAHIHYEPFQEIFQSFQPDSLPIVLVVRLT